MKNTKEQVEYILRSYSNMQKEAHVLEYELQKLTRPLHPDTIEGIVLSHSNGERVTGPMPGDKTANLAIEHVDKQRNKEYQAISALLRDIKMEIHRLDYYLTLLPPKTSEAISLYFFQNKSSYEIAEEVHVSRQTVNRRLKKGVSELITFYAVLDKVDPSKMDVGTRARFVSYLHGERFTQCMDRLGKNRGKCAEAVLYLLTGANELWNTGIDALFDFEQGVSRKDAIKDMELSGAAVMLFRLARYFDTDFPKKESMPALRAYFSSMDFLHLELAVEAVKLAFFPGIY